MKLEHALDIGNVARHSPPKVKILLVDDQQANLLALEAILQNLGQTVVKARSGPEALQNLLHADFAVILMDVQMPGMDGFETAAWIRSQEKSRHTPIIFVTGFNTSEGHMFKGYSVGAVDYLYKPVVPEILKSKVAVFVELFQKTEELKRQAKLLRERTAQLEEAVQDLEAFSYSISHDLRAPLRAIEGFSRMLMDEFAPDLCEQARAHLQQVHDSTQEMEHLVSDLLAFARLGGKAVKKRRVEPAMLVRQALESLRAEHAGRCVEFHVEDLPACLADPTLLKQVWTNLLSNAIKYTRKRAAAVIRVGTRTDHNNPDEAVYFVQDNGVGFDMQLAHKLFGVFKRLHRADEYEGTGVGLAIVRRIIQRHGGRIWADARPDQGATFCFALEKVPAEA